MTDGPVIAIVKHPARSIDDLAERVSPDVIAEDRELLGAGRNHLRALSWAIDAVPFNAEHPWLVILEDDAIVVPNFRDEVMRCLAHAPSMIVSLYNGTGYPQQYQREFIAATATDASWILHSHLRHAVGYAVHLNAAIPMTTGVLSNVMNRWAMDDAISVWARKAGIMVSYSNPSIVDHRDGETVLKSRTHLGKHTFGRKRARKAHTFGVPLTWNDSTVVV